MTEESIFAAAVAMPDAPARAAYLDRACAGNIELRKRLDALVAAHFAADPLLDPATRSLPTPLEGEGLGVRGSEETRTAPTAEEVPGRVIAGRYKLRQPIGEGGMGTVWLADQTEPVRRKVAVKLVRADRGQSATILARFEAERQAIALMDHPHIAKLLDAGSVDGAPYFVMELVKGVPLTEYCDAHTLSVPDRLSLFQQICSAVQHAHQKGVIHRDLKPGNILVESHDGKPVPKVIDFGLAKATSGLRLTENTLFTGFGSVMGTPLYMAPEQATFNAVDVDTRADVYALGVILYELLTGTTPITRDTLKKAAMDEMLRLIREQEAPTPSSRLSSAAGTPSVAASRQTEPAKLGRFVKGELDWIVLKALSKDRDRRYETANGFAKDIERFLNHEPVTAGPPTAGYKLRKFVQRNRQQVVAAGTVLVALLAGIAGTTLGLIRADERRQEAEQARKDEADRAEGERLAKIEAQKAAVAEKAANEQAQKRLVQIKNGVDMLAKVLTRANPRNEENNGQPLYAQLRDSLSEAADQLDAEAVGDPLAVAHLQNVLGNSLSGLGNVSKAVAVLVKARATYERLLGPDHMDTLHAQNSLAVAYQGSGRTTEAVSLLERLCNASEANHGLNHPHTLMFLTNLASAYRDDGRTDAAITLFRRVLDALSKSPTPSLKQNLVALGGLALTYKKAGRLAEAIPIYMQVRDATATLYDTDHVSTLTTLNNLAQALIATGRVIEAIPILERVRDIKLAIHGRDHLPTLANEGELAVAYWQASRLDRSIPLFEDILRREQRLLGRQHLQTQRTVANLGINYRDAGRTADAVPLLEEAYKASRKYPELAFVGMDLVDVYRQAGDSDKAISFAKDWLRAARRRTSPDGHELASVGWALMQLELWDYTVAILRESVTIREKAEPDAWRTFNTQSLLGKALLGQRKVAEAEPLLLKGYEGMKARQDSVRSESTTRVPEALDRLIELYTATDKPDEAKKYRALRAAYREVLPPPRRE